MHARWKEIGILQFIAIIFSVLLGESLVTSPVAAQILPFLPQSPRDLQRSSAKRMKPAPLQLVTQRNGGSGGQDPITLRLRVLAARDYRAHTMDWQGRLRQMLGRINRQAERWPGVRFEIVEMRAWERDTLDQPLKEILSALKAEDSGEDVDWVIGLAAAVPRMPELIHTLGVAPTLGRHFVLRSLHDLAEYEVVRQSFDQLDPIDREQLVSERKAHKEQIVFLHEWAHTLGAIHTQRPGLIMAPMYDSDAARFDDGNARIIEWAVAHRRSQGLRWRDSARQELRELLGNMREDAWVPEERDSAMAAFASVASIPGVKDGGRTEPGSSSANPEVGKEGVLAGCMAARDAPVAERLRKVEAACDTNAPGVGPWPLLIRAEVHLAAGQIQDAATEMGMARTVLGSVPRELAPEKAWATLAMLYRKGRWPSLASEAALHTDKPTRDSFAAWLLTMRRRLALPANAAQHGLPPAREREYILRAESAEAAIDQGQATTAGPAVDQFAQEFPLLPAGNLLRCELSLAQGRLPEAASACDAALQKQEDASGAHFLAGLIAGRRGQHTQELVHLRRAVDLDPDTRESWPALAEALRQSGQSTAAQEVEANFRRRFGGASVR